MDFIQRVNLLFLYKQIMVYLFSLMFCKWTFCFQKVIKWRSQLVFLYGCIQRDVIRSAARHVIRRIYGKTYANRNVIPDQRAFIYFYEDNNAESFHRWRLKRTYGIELYQMLSHTLDVTKWPSIREILIYYMLIYYILIYHILIYHILI